MSWRETFAVAFGPGLFGGTSFGNWLGLLRANRFVTHPARIPRFLSISSCSVANSAYRWLERRRFESRYMEEEIQKPLFVLGHWRSGTTHLHNLLACDDRFAFPNLYQVLNPHTFLTTEAVNTRLTSVFLPETRLGMDNVRFGWGVPYEDEFAIAVAAFCSPYLAFAFPRRCEFYDKYLTLRNVTAEDLAKWKTALTVLLKKLTWKHKKPLVLKSPGHTCRIRVLLEMFPDARFIHIRRNPYLVFQSMRRMISAAIRFWDLQSVRSVDWDERFVRQYCEMHDAFFDERPLIPHRQFHEVSFEELVADPIAQVRNIYEALDLPDFDYVERPLQEYVASLSGYEQNVFPEIPMETRERIVGEWLRCFEEWGYPT